MKKIDYTDPMSQFQGRKTSKIVTQRKLDEKKAKSEWSEQLVFCKWLKNEYPDILFRSDIQSAGKLSVGMQNVKQIIDPYSGWPDVIIFSLNLQIEMKSTTASLSGEHWRNQEAMHIKLRALGWRVEVAKGSEEAKRIFLAYLNKS